MLPLAVIHHVHGCHTTVCDRRVSTRRHESYWTRRQRRLTSATRIELAGLRYCESTDDYQAVSPDGTYTGGYQFDDRTWHLAGGRGRARDASPAEQDVRTWGYILENGLGPWPVCGQRA